MVGITTLVEGTSVLDGGAVLGGGTVVDVGGGATVVVGHWTVSGIWTVVVGVGPRFVGDETRAVSLREIGGDTTMTNMATTAPTEAPKKRSRGALKRTTPRLRS